MPFPFPHHHSPDSLKVNRNSILALNLHAMKENTKYDMTKQPHWSTLIQMHFLRYRIGNNQDFLDVITEIKISNVLQE
jgi:hypothetical protein